MGCNDLHNQKNLCQNPKIRSHVPHDPRDKNRRRVLAPVKFENGSQPPQIEGPSTSQILAECSSSGGFQVRDCKHAAKALERRHGKVVVEKMVEPKTEIEEQDFMKELLTSLDEGFFEDLPSSLAPVSTPIRQNIAPSSLPSLPKVSPLKECKVKLEEASSDYILDSIPSADLAELLDNDLDRIVKEPEADIGLPAEPLTPRRFRGLQSNLCDGLELDDFTLTQTSPIANNVRREESFSQIGPSHGRPASGSPSSHREYARCYVTDVFEHSVPRAESSHSLEKVLKVNITKIGVDTQELGYVHLLDDWALEAVEVGQIVNVIGHFDHSDSGQGIKVVTIDKKIGFLIVYPDMLITVTSVADATSCTRRSLLKEMVRQSGPSDCKPSAMYGNMIHLLIQRSLARCVTLDGEGSQSLDYRLGFDISVIRQEIDSILLEHLEKLWVNGIQLEIARKELVDVGMRVSQWASVYVVGNHGHPQKEATLIDARSNAGEPPRMLITALADVEEDILSPMWGLRGKIDLSVAVKEREGPVSSLLVRPLELKSGKRSAVFEHDVQTMLYTLLMSERYDARIAAGVLFYTSSMSTSRVRAQHNELRGIIQKRNELASILYKESVADRGQKNIHQLPESIDNTHMCKTCFHKANCMLYGRAVEGESGEERATQNIFDEYTGHLSQRHCDFFRHWERLLTLEERESANFKRLQWTTTAEEREKAGNAFADMVVIRGGSNATSNVNVSRIQRWSYTFERSGSSHVSKSLSSGHLEVGSTVSISCGTDLVGLAKGYITEMTSTNVTISCDRPLNSDRKKSKKFDPAFNQLYDFGKVTAMGACPTLAPEQTYRIDKDEYASGLSKVRDNLIQLLNRSDDRLARLIIDLEKPHFVEDAKDIPIAEELLSVLNSDQRRAIQKVLKASDYTYILGMPGTGKTTTIAQLVKILISKGFSVLLAAYTHSAVDNILLKLVSSGIQPLRLGNTDKIHPDLQQYAWSRGTPASTLNELDARINGPQIVATTSLSLDHTMFAKRGFDYCIVDEASQVTLPVCIGPLRFAERFVLVGDHLQLPPIIKSNRAQSDGLEESLFKILTEAHPEAGTYLRIQYRMNADIMSISNSLIYKGQLRCGNEQVASRRLFLPRSLDVDTSHKSNGCHASKSMAHSWLHEILAPKRSVIFVDIDEVPAIESETHDSNDIEASLLATVADALVSCGLEAQNIGVISAYRRQVRRLKRLLRQHGGLEILTADKSQGRDKECILVSLVRSNAEANVGNLLADWRRINVSFTRARSKLIVFGSKRTLRSNPLLAQFLEKMNSNGWIMTLPSRAHLTHELQSNDERQCKRELSSPTFSPRSQRTVKRVVGQVPERRSILGDITNVI